MLWHARVYILYIATNEVTGEVPFPTSQLRFFLLYVHCNQSPQLSSMLISEALCSCSSHSLSLNTGVGSSIHPFCSSRHGEYLVKHDIDVIAR